MKKATGSYHKKSAKIGFHEWGLDAMDEYQDLMKRIIKEGLELATAEYECHAWFPIEWAYLNSDGVRDMPVEDPKLIYVELPIGPTGDDNPRWSFKLDDLVESMIGGSEHGENGPIDDDAKPGFIAVRDGLRELADKIDAALSRS